MNIQQNKSVDEQSSSSFSKRILIMSRGLARYRLKLTQALDDAFQGKVQIISAPHPDHRNLWEVEWEKLKRKKGSLLFRDIERVSLCDLISAALFRFKVGGKISFSENSRKISEIRPDLIMIHEYSLQMILIAMYARIAGIPCGVFTDLGKDMLRHDEIRKFTRVWHSLAAWLTDFQIAQTPGAKNPFGAKHRPIYFFPYSIDTREFTPKNSYSKNDEVILLMVAQYTPIKGADLLLKALRIVCSRSDQKFRLRLIGYRNPDWILPIIENSGLKSVIDLVGVKKGKDLLEEYHRADIFILPSRSDTYGVVVHEAASAALPLLISKNAGAAEILVEDGRNGWIVDPENSEKLATNLITLMEDPVLREDMGKNSRAIAEKLCVRRGAISCVEWMNQWI
jgi:glycosyltransferase involved in cell wall biosynthesis